MRILLLNDNPVVRKLVTLSAQKTKDDLHIVWSVDEIEHQLYDLLIVDDALYSDETMMELGQKIQYKTSLLMATRGNGTPAGFDKVINKPFLPTDLVELFSNIEKSVATKAVETPSEPAISTNEEATSWLDESDESLDMLLDETVPMDTAVGVFDQEEVQELQNLLEDTEDEDFDLSAFGLDEDEEIATLADGVNVAELDEEDDFLSLLEEPSADFEAGKLEDQILDDAMLEDMPETAQEESWDDLLLEEMEDEDSLDSEIPLEAPLSDDDFDTLEQQIQDAVGSMEVEDLESEIEEIDLDTLNLDGLNSLEELDELDGIDERALKLAIGEEIDDEPTISVGKGEHTALDIEALNEAISMSSNDVSEFKSLETSSTSPKEGVEALQTLLRALSNDEIVKSLKGLNISININFGNEK